MPIFALVDCNNGSSPWRGEHCKSWVAIEPEDGSSPLARGTPRRTVRARQGGRFIPAGAGNTPRWTRRTARLPVHPRWRGEHLRFRAKLESACGSSPLARGTRWLVRRDDRKRRFIPAGAGNTYCGARHRCAGSVHPRWRGEHLLGQPGLEYWVGSSPLARGTPGTRALTLTGQRFIPAGAGNTRV